MGNLPSVDAEVYAEELKVAGEDRPEPRQSAAVVQLSDNELILFGGGSGSTEAAQFADVWVLTLTETTKAGAKWRHIVTTGDAPCARTGHALALLGKSVVCVGGTSAERGFLNDMHVLDTDTWTWSTPIEESTLADSGFTPRDKLTAVCHGNSVLVFGGFGPQQDGDDAGADAEDGDEEEGEEEEEQDGTSFSWFDQVFIASRGDKGCWLWRHQPATGDAPSPRAAHGAACLGSCMYVFGGRDASGRVNDSYSLDCSSWVWSKHEAQVAPAPRSFHAFVPLPPPLLCCVTFGGLAADGKSLDGLEVMDAHQQPLQWLSAQQRSGAWPAARSSSAAALLSDRLIVLGGVGADDKCCPDVVLHLAPLVAALRQKEQAV